MGMGELMSAPIMESILAAKGYKVELIDSRDMIITTGNQGEGDPDYHLTDDAFKPYRTAQSTKRNG